MKKVNTMKLVGVALLTAIVVVLQVVVGSIKAGPFSITLSLVPIVVGAALYGKKAGAWLGFVFGCLTLLDAAAFFAISIPATVFVCLLKGTLAGLCAATVYSLTEKVNGILAVALAAITAPVVNTGVFLIGCSLFFLDAVKAWGQAAGFENVFLFMIVGFVGINFLVELGVNLILSPAIVRIVAVGKKNLAKKNDETPAKTV